MLRYGETAQQGGGIQGVIREAAEVILGGSSNLDPCESDS